MVCTAVIEMSLFSLVFTTMSMGLPPPSFCSGRIDMIKFHVNYSTAVSGEAASIFGLGFCLDFGEKLSNNVLLILLEEKNCKIFYSCIGLKTA